MQQCENNNPEPRISFTAFSPNGQSTIPGDIYLSDIIDGHHLLTINTGATVNMHFTSNQMAY
jgi:hypothetical protein